MKREPEDSGLRPKPNTRCPVCGKANGCVPAGCGRFDVACWCTSVTIGAAVLARIPPEMRGEACLCPACAAA